jgi:hypothetical protein
LNSHADYSAHARTGYYVSGAEASTINQKVRVSDEEVPNRTVMRRFLNELSLSTESRPFMLTSAIKDILDFEKKHPIKGQPAPGSATKHFDFKVVAKRFANLEGKPVATIDLQLDAEQVFFYFMDGQYRGRLYLAILQKDKLLNFRDYRLRFSEEEFGLAIQSKIPLSITISPPKNGDIRILVLSMLPFTTAHYSIQSIKIQP